VADRLTKKQRREETQAKLAAMRAVQARRERRAKLFTALAAVLSVLLVVGVFVIIKVNAGGTKAKSAATGAAPAAVVSAVTGVPLATYNTIGAGSIQTTPTAMKGAEAITADGKPRVLYVGAEYCPFCAAERWAMVAALSRFGTFSNLGITSSSASDSDPSTATLSFHGATYTSDSLSFTGYETTTNQQQSDGSYPTLDTPSAADEALVTKYDAPPFVDADSKGSIPFVDIGGKFVISGASYDPALLAGKTHQQIADAMADPTSDIAKAIDGTANVITAAICQITQQAPTNVCTSAGVEAGAAKLSAS
jgi:Domain of unknown function (DUF929)